uniref:RRM domain-containing protein n=1 Tax=Peronospora matthiolae TaxID=2874970 RepID=A0AAV1UDH3_9STRA
MALNVGFSRGGTSSWADDDDDDADFQPLPGSAKISATETPPPIEEEETLQKREQQYDEPRQGSHREHFRDEGRDGHRDRRGGYEERREVRAPREERPKNPVPDAGPWKLFVGNLSYRVTPDDLAEFIGVDGIKDIRLPRDYDNRSKGIAFVEFDDKEKLVKALELDGVDCDGRRVKMDVVLESDRKSRDKGRFEKRSDQSSTDRSRRRSEGNIAPQERPRLSLLPRTTSSGQKDSGEHKPNIFGEAKPRDESAYLERKKALDLEREMKAKEAKEKAKEAKEAKEATEAKEAKAKVDAEVAVSARKSSRDDGSRRGRGRGRGDRRPVDGGRGRGASVKENVDGGRGRGASVKENVPARKSEVRPKRVEPVKIKILEPAPAKTANPFGILNDSDSDSD